MTKIAVIGAGYMAREHIKALKALDETMPIGIMGRTKTNVDSIADEFDIPIRAASIKELYDRTKAEALIIAVNELASPEIIGEALKYPWIMLVEKPVSLDIDLSYKLEQERVTLNRQVYVAMNRRHYASTLKTAFLLQDDKNQRIIEVHDQENIIAAANSGVPSEVISSWMVANSIHLVDYFNIFCRGRLVNLRVNSELDTKSPFFTSSFLEYDSGDIGIYTALWNAPGPWSVKITTRHQMLEMRPLEELEQQVFPQKRKHIVELPEHHKTYKAGLLTQASALILAVQGERHSLPTLKDYIDTHALVNKLYPRKIKVSNDSF